MMLVTGANGQLGRNFGRQMNVVGLDRKQLDISDWDSVESVFHDLEPSVLINCAAYTAVDTAEDEPLASNAINALGVQNLAKIATQKEALLVHISTDYVFGSDTDSERPHREDDEITPQGEYARSKRQGEIFAAQCPNHLIIRTCGLYGLGGNNFVETMLRLAAQRNELSIVNDQFCNPTSTETVVHAVQQLIAAGQRGVFHVVNSGGMSWYDFAGEIFRQSNLDIKLNPISTKEFGAKAPRPSYSVLDTSHYETATGDTLPSIPEALAAYLSQRAT